ncbi:ribosomal RNA processing protein 1 homolog A isoform X2 [Gouania willdenowi]|uniref:ribosomal RNA processing protein 1 homolog A isoform X2 n=1 Tax=Gouania willdenowi TaxID=441366 RepID=UPI0010562316|nr:ribosomal RNA processing protein 1 homolog B isoform X2 [Gouania willdenowi]
MADTQQPEILLAQRLASNEKSIRSKALRKLRKYISVRSLKGGFTHDELLKLWKGLFYCLWMQDKPLLQENLSAQISALIHTFQDYDRQLLYLESFFVTFKREWTGIDRLRMDKFYQLVRFMFREAFEVLKKTNWEKSAIVKFVDLLTVQLLQSSSGAPSGLQLHILDLYLTELSAVGALQLSAEENLTFIEPFCKIAAKTKDRTLFSAICNSIFSSIIDQAPFAIEDLMKEIEADQDSDSDSGQASDEDQQIIKDHKSKSVGKQRVEHINGIKENEDDGEGDEALNDSEPSSDDTEPVLQFDYSALADKLLESASRSSTPAHNRQRLYKIIKVLRDLHEGVFPRHEDSDEVSTDEDDEMFGSRKFIPRRRDRVKKSKDGEPVAKKRKKEETPDGQNKDSEAADASVPEKKKKKKRRRRRKKKSKKLGDADKPEQEVNETKGETTTVSEGDQKSSPALLSEEGQTQSSSEPEVPSGTVGEKGARPESSSTDEPKEEHSHTSSDVKASGKKKRKIKSSVLTGAGADMELPAEQKKTTAEGETDRAEAESMESQSQTCVKRTVKNKRKAGLAEIDETCCVDPEGEETSTNLDQPIKKKKKKKKSSTSAESADDTDMKSEPLHPTAQQGLKKKKQKVGPAPMNSEAEVTSNGKAAQKKKKRKIPVEFEFEADEQQVAEMVPETSAQTKHDTQSKPKPLMSKTSQRMTATGSQSPFVTFQRRAAIPKPLYWKHQGGGATKKSPNGDLKSKKVTFGLKNNKTAAETQGRRPQVSAHIPHQKDATQDQ